MEWKINSDLKDIETMKPLLLALKQYHFKFIIHIEFGQDFYHLFQKY
jgi:hypothetical protein